MSTLHPSIEIPNDALGVDGRATPQKGILIVLKKGCDWTKKCIAVYH